jgi:hypothetical protein
MKNPRGIRSATRNAIDRQQHAYGLTFIIIRRRSTLQLSLPNYVAHLLRIFRQMWIERRLGFGKLERLILLEADEGSGRRFDKAFVLADPSHQEKFRHVVNTVVRRFIENAWSLGIRPWDNRVLVNEYTSIHRRCRESRQFFIEFVRWHFQLASGVTVLPQTPELLRATELIQLIVCSFYDEVQRNGNGSVQSEYIRGMPNGAKSMLAELRGQATKERVLNEARSCIARPFPSALPLAEDGNRYGWDIEAEAGSP